MTPQFLRNLVPKRERDQHGDVLSVWKGVKSMTALQWAFFFAGWIAWTCDALDFFSVSLSVPALSKLFHKNTGTIVCAILYSYIKTADKQSDYLNHLVALVSLSFGLLSDRFGRKWPLVVNLLLCCVFELASGFATNFKQFLAFRSLFGVMMGGVWGAAVSCALETMPVQVRGLAGGIIQQGYSLGYILAAVINLFLVPETRHGWRALFWTAAGCSFFAACFRACLPESDVFLRARAASRAAGITSSSKKTSVFLRELATVLKNHWKLFIYMVLMMTGFTFLSHGSGDLYPTFLQVTKGFTPRHANIATIIANCGSVSGGMIAGATSQFIGRRLTILICLILAGALIPAWVLPHSFSALAAGAFFLQVGVQGPWGVFPSFISEMAPPAFRAVFAGTAYQIGNMVSAGSAQIEATAGDHQKTIVNGKVVPDYVKVQGIFIGIIVAYCIIIVMFAPEKHGAHFEQHKLAFENGGGDDDAYVDDDKSSVSQSSSSDIKIEYAMA